MCRYPKAKRSRSELPRPSRRRPGLSRRGLTPSPDETRRLQRQEEANLAAKATLRSKLVERCNARGISVSQPHQDVSKLELQIPNGEDTVDVLLSCRTTHETRRIVQAVSSGIQWIGPYAAFAELDDGYIEAVIRSVSPLEPIPAHIADYSYRVDPECFPGELSENSSGKLPGLTRERNRQGRVLAEDEQAGVKIEVSDFSLLAQVLKRRLLPVPLLIPPWDVGAHVATIKISTSDKIRDREAAKEILESAAKSFSFRLDVISDGGFQLCRAPSDVELDGALSSHAQARSPIAQPLQIKLDDYASKPLSYYWHARQSNAIPAMEFLGYYQVLEHHFERYALRSIIDLFREEVVRPNFDPWDDESTEKIVYEIGDKYKRTRGHDEPSLFATLKHCVAEDSLTDFITSDASLRKYLRRRDAIPNVPCVEPGQEEIIKNVARRICEVRNQLVHANAERDARFTLVPGSQEIQYIEQEIKLAKFVAQAVICASSK